MRVCWAKLDQDATKRKVEGGCYFVIKTRKMHFSSVHVLSYNFCIGWLLVHPTKITQVLFSAQNDFFCGFKGRVWETLSLMRDTLSVANGTTASSFYSTLSEFNNLNRAFMPKMQLNYIVTDSESLRFSLKGDILMLGLCPIPSLS